MFPGAFPGFSPLWEKQTSARWVSRLETKNALLRCTKLNETTKNKFQNQQVWWNVSNIREKAKFCQNWISANFWKFCSMFCDWDAIRKILRRFTEWEYFDNRLYRKIWIIRGGGASVTKRGRGLRARLSSARQARSLGPVASASLAMDARDWID